MNNILARLIFLLSFLPPALAIGGEYELYITKVTHSSEKEFDQLNRRISQENVIVIDGTSFPESLTLGLEVCVAPLNEEAITYIERIFVQGEIVTSFTDFYLIAKVKLEDVDGFAINGLREMRNKDGEVRVLVDNNFAKLMGYFDAIYDMNECNSVLHPPPFQ